MAGLFERLAELAGDVLGLGGEAASLSIGETILRAAVVYLAIVIAVRLGERRFMTRGSPFDLVLAIMLGSVASRAITGNAPLAASLAASVALVLCHHAVSALTFRFRPLGHLTKGEPRILVRDGKVQWQVMARSHLTERDLESALRRKGVVSVERVGLAILERNGTISVFDREEIAGDGAIPERPVRGAGQSRDHRR